MKANNSSQLSAMIMNDIKKAMTVSREKGLAETYKEVGEFYTQGNPKEYERTGALGDTPRATPLTVNKGKSGGSVSFDIYLDTSHKYTTGANPNMQQVLDLANSGIPFKTPSGLNAKPTVGKKGFWEESEKAIERELHSTLKQFFK